MLVMSDNRTQECPSDVDLTSLNWLHNLDIMSNMSVPSLPTPPDSPAPPSDKCASGGSAKKNCIQRPKSVDYRTDGESKPPYSYAMLICMAMKANNNKMTLSAIYKWIRDNFLYYKNAEPSWQNSIRHNLSLNKCFIKIPRSKDEPGKGGFWQLDPAYADREEEGMFKRRRLTTSTPSGNNASRNRRNRNSRKVVQPAKNHILLQPLPAAPMLTPTATPSPGPSCIEVSVPMAVSNNFDATFFLPEELLVPSTGCSVEGAHTQLSPLSIKLEEFNQSEASECCGVDQDLERLLTAWDDTPIDFESLLDFASL